MNYQWLYQLNVEGIIVVVITIMMMMMMMIIIIIIIIIIMIYKSSMSAFRLSSLSVINVYCCRKSEITKNFHFVLTAQ